jgi:diguanylate cyclase (GGDEF)-like protein
VTEDFYSLYRSHLERYVYEGASEAALLAAYQDLMRSLDDNHFQAANILDIHTRALREIMGIRRDSDNVQWIYIDRATEFLAQILIVIDTFLLQLKDRVEHDPLTGLYNRLALSRLLPQLVQKAQERQAPLVVAMFDLDDFKQVNDRFGHAVGDDVLRRLATMTRRCLRAGDIVVRFGGEEFLVVLPGTSAVQSLIPLDRLRRQVEEEPFLPEGTRLTVSIGVAECPKGGTISADELVSRADRALYRAKEKGKNRIEIAEEGE